ncbi:hypothetical protein ABIA32_002742 [Streptacidiphilus sp. MAP12-20]|uniref:hypothetical protein n=1 Tax=Streptacidiphilus sp. MAP12-20 TaxID=3156299 RepID=UPI0035177C03
MTLLDWRTGHWAEAAAPCRFCWQPTHLRDDYRRPAHKVCAEQHPQKTAEPPQRGRSR